MNHENNVKNNSGLGIPERIRVLRYHRITADGERTQMHGMCLPAKVFTSHLNLLERWGFTTITFNDYRLFLVGKLNLPRKPVILTFDGAYLDNYSVMFPILRRFGATAVVFAHGDRNIKEDVWHSDPRVPRAAMMNDQNLLELNAAGIEIGSQAMTHPDLTSLESEQAAEEIIRSRILLEILLNAPVLSFAYPFGMVNDTVKQMVAEAGYSIACCVNSGPSAFGQDHLEVRRITMKDDRNAFRFGLRLFLCR